VATLLLGQVPQADVAAKAGRRVNANRVWALRHQYGLEHCPKQQRRSRVVAAMVDMLARRFSEDEVRQVVAGSDSAWWRARKWYREDRDLEPTDPLEGGVIGGDLWRPMQDMAERTRLVEEDLARRGARGTFTLLSGKGWSFMRGDLLRRYRQEVGNVHGADVGDPWSDMHYVNWRDRQDEIRALRASEEREAASG
jgi:hypothetical protein